MKNRVKAHVDEMIETSFSGYSLPSRLRLFEGVKGQKIDVLVKKYIIEREERAKAEGRREAWEEMKAKYQKRIDEYILLVTKIVDVINELAKNKIAVENFKVVESRTNFDFDTLVINILFVINADMEHEFNFSEILTSMKEIVLQEENFVAELLYINKSHSDIDKTTVAYDYPFKRTSS